MIARIPAEDRPNIIVRHISSYAGLMGLDLNREMPRASKTPIVTSFKRCLSCGALTNRFGELPCGH